MKAAAKSKPVVSPPGKKKKPAQGTKPPRRSRARAVPEPSPRPNKTASVRDLRNNFAMLSAWLEKGFDVEIMKNGKFFAMLRLAEGAAPRAEKPDFQARLQKIFGDEIVDTSSWIADIRKERF